MARQLPLGLPPLERRTRQDFLPAPQNEAALAFLDSWPAWPGPVLVLQGPAGSGKSHLAAIWRAQAEALVLTSEALLGEAARAILGSARAALFEDLDRALAVEPRLDEPLFSLHTAMVERGGHLLLTARQPVKRWCIKLPDLASRLRAAATVTLAPPDEALMAQLLVKLLADRQVPVEPEVVQFVTTRLERSFAAVEEVAARLDQAALAERRQVTIPLARGVLAQLAAEDSNDSNE